MTFTRVTVRPEQMSGVPCIRGLRLPVATVVGMTAEGMTDTEILGCLPRSRARGHPRGAGVRGRSGSRARTAARPRRLRFLIDNALSPVAPT